MSRVVRILLLLAAACIASSAHGFEVAWTDSFGETTYTIAGPDVVFVNEAFDVTLSAVDLFYPDAMVAAPWSFLEDSVEVDGGFGIFLTDTLWTNTYSFLYDATGVHSYEFTGQDLGHGGGGHSWEWFSVGSTVVISPPTSASEASWAEIKGLFRR